VENLGTQGNNRRLLLALLQKHAPALLEASGGHLDIADIAAGTLGMTRALSEDERYTVWSTDISGAMLEAGKASLMKSLPDEQVMERAMDDLPYKSGSKHVAFHSLALDCTKHSSRSLDKGGAERINALLELNRILCDGGVAFLTLQASVFENTESFDVFKKTVGTYFGFTLVEEDTGFAQSTDHTDEEQFEGVVLTLRKTGKPRCNAATLPMDAWLALHFYKKAPLVSTEKERFVRTPGIAHPPPGAYHEAFTIAGKDVHYAQPQEPQEKKQHKKRKQRYSATCAAIDRLIQEYGSIKKIPTEQLLSVSLEEIDTTTQRIRDLYFRELLKKYDGRIDAIPLEEISRKSPVILVPMHEKNIGWFLVLATIDPETKKLGTYGKKYFLEEEFHNRSGEKADEASSIDSPIQA
jgi:SAM-dependent methyltransferase